MRARLASPARLAHLALLAALAALAPAAARPEASPLVVSNHAVCRGFPLQGAFALSSSFAGSTAFTHLGLFDREAFKAVPEAEGPTSASAEIDGADAIAQVSLGGRAAGSFEFSTLPLRPSRKYALALCRPNEGAEAAAEGDIKGARLRCAYRVKLTVQRDGSPVCEDEHQPSVFGAPVDETLSEDVVVRQAALVAGHFSLEVASHTRPAEAAAAWFNVSAPAGPGGVQFTLELHSLRPRVEGNDTAARAPEPLGAGEEPAPSPGTCLVHVSVPAGTVMARMQALRQAGSGHVRVASAFPHAGAGAPVAVNWDACHKHGDAALKGVARDALAAAASRVVEQYFRSLAGFAARDPCVQRHFLSPVQSSNNDAAFSVGVHYRRDTARANVVLKSPVVAEIFGAAQGKLLANAGVSGSNQTGDDVYAPDVTLSLLASPGVANRLAAALANPDLGERAHRVYTRASAFLVALAESARHEEFLANALRAAPTNPMWEFDAPEAGAGAKVTARGHIDVELLSLARSRVLCAEQHTRIAERVIEPDDTYGSADPLFAHAERVAEEALTMREEDASAAGGSGESSSSSSSGDAAAAAAATVVTAKEGQEKEEGGASSPSVPAQAKEPESVRLAEQAEALGREVTREAAEEMAEAAASFLQLAATESGLRLPLDDKALKRSGPVTLAAAALEIATRPVLRDGMAGTSVVIGTSASGAGAVLRVGGKAVRVHPGTPLVDVAVLQRGPSLSFEAAPMAGLRDAAGPAVAAEVAAVVSRVAGYLVRSPCTQRTYPTAASEREAAAVAAATTAPRSVLEVAFGGAGVVSASLRLSNFAPAVFRRQVPHRARAAGFHAVVKRAGTHALGVSLVAGDARLSPRAWSHLLVNVHEMVAASLASRAADGVSAAAAGLAEMWAGRSEEAVRLWQGRAGGPAMVQHGYPFLAHACELRRWTAHAEGLEHGGDAAQVRAARGRVAVELERVRQMRRLEDMAAAAAGAGAGALTNGTHSAPTRDEVVDMTLATAKAHAALDSLVLAAPEERKEVVARASKAHAGLRVNPFELASAVREAAASHEMMESHRQRFEAVAIAGGSLGAIKDVTMRELVLREHELRAKNVVAAARALSRPGAAARGYTPSTAEEIAWLDRGGTGGADEPGVEV